MGDGFENTRSGGDRENIEIGDGCEKHRRVIVVSQHIQVMGVRTHKRMVVVRTP